MLNLQLFFQLLIIRRYDPIQLDVTATLELIYTSTMKTETSTLYLSLLQYLN